MNTTNVLEAPVVTMRSYGSSCAMALLVAGVLIFLMSLMMLMPSAPGLTFNPNHQSITKEFNTADVLRT